MVEITCDLHIHSKYSRACSKDLVPEEIARWAKIKGVGLVGTGDFTHPLWIKELKEKLEPAGDGFYQLKPNYRDTKTRGQEPLFVFSSEISCIYSKNGRVRRIHVLLVAPSLEVAEQINAHLGWRGNLKSDGRPILGLDVKELTKIALNVSPESIVIPAHCLLPSEHVHTKDGTKEIQRIQKGDYVYTHKGRLRRVEEVYTRPYRGTTYHIRSWHFRIGLETTPEHPFFAIKTQKHCRWQHGFCKPGCAGRGHCCKRHEARPENLQPRWIRAEDLEKSDVLVFPRLTKTVDIDSLPLSVYTAKMPGIILSEDTRVHGASTVSP